MKRNGIIFLICGILLIGAVILHMLTAQTWYDLADYATKWDHITDRGFMAEIYADRARWQLVIAGGYGVAALCFLISAVRNLRKAKAAESSPESSEAI